MRSLAEHPVEALLAGEVRVRLKHALAVIATEAGYGSWLDLKQAAADGAPPMHVPAMDVLLNAWFSDYAGARAARDRHGNRLLTRRLDAIRAEPRGTTS